MSMIRAAGLVVVLWSALIPDLGEACSVCQAGDPVFSSGAAGPRESGSLSAYVEYQGYRKDSGLLPEEPGGEVEPGHEVNRGRQLNANLTWGVLDRLSLSVQVPFKSTTIRERADEEEPEGSRLTGLSDVSLTADYVIWRDRPILPATFVNARLFGKAPTGDDRQREDGRVDPHLQLGTGSWDYGLGLGAGHRLSWGSLYASALYRINRQGANRYEYGDVVLANVAVETPVGHLVGRTDSADNTVALELNYRHARRDQFGPSAYRDSGGSVLYATPSLRVRLPGLASERAPSLRLAVQLPFGDGGLRGDQHEGLVWSVGLILPLR